MVVPFASGFKIQDGQIQDGLRAAAWC